MLLALRSRIGEASGISLRKGRRNDWILSLTGSAWVLNGVMAVAGEAGVNGTATPVGTEGDATGITGTRACCADAGTRPASSNAKEICVARSWSFRVGCVVMCMVFFKRIVSKF